MDLNKQTKEVRLYSGEEVYCPYWEEGNPMLEIGLGCSWHRCKFCYFTNDGFSTFPLDEIDAKAKMLVPYAEGKTRLFLLGQNSLVQPTEKLVAVSEIISNHMPQIEQISTYARIDDVLRKSDAELKLLRHYNICHVHLGIESGDDEVLAFMDKGITAADIELACEKLRNADIKYSFNVILGLGGKNRSEAHIRATADIINRTRPQHIMIMDLQIWENTILEGICREGGFAPLGMWEFIGEAGDLIDSLDSWDCGFAYTTLLNRYTLAGNLLDKNSLMQKFYEVLKAEGLVE